MSNPFEQIIDSVIVGSPLGRLLGAVRESVETDRVVVRLPYRTEITTVGDLIHGGSISALVDIAATAAAWSHPAAAAAGRGTTIGFSINFLRGARSADILADARVIQRGKTICVIDVAVTHPDKPDSVLSRAIVNYKMG